MSQTFTSNKGPFFLESEIGRTPATEAGFHILPIPFEASVSYGGGACRGADAIIHASQQLELYDGYSFPGKEGIFTHEALNIAAELNIAASTENGAAVDASPDASPDDSRVDSFFQKAQEKCRAILEAGAVPVVLGGEHSISFGPIMATADYAKSRGTSLGIVQIDAHADMRLAYEGKVWSHASVMRRCADLHIPIAQIAVRALCWEEYTYRKDQDHVYYWDASELNPGQCNQVDTICLPDNFPPDIYVSIDLDGLDPSILPATGTPVPGGLLWYQALSILESIVQQRNVLAFDMVELAPQQSAHFADFTAAQLVYNMMGFVQRNRTNPLNRA